MLSALMLVYQFVTKDPQVVNAAVNRAVAPGAVSPNEIRGAIGDVAHAVLTCYHKTARMQGLQDTRLSLQEAPQYGADQSDILVIRYIGITGRQYVMAVALMARGSGDSAEMRAVVIKDTAVIPYARGCPLQDWTSVS
ncbi:hypothetical protein [Burkholderia sp. IMCC1007]|uniref:hypothetical protein n=1 Tax=Burkholderia sp. IMCC1007 TaxID=3004104 RepID=UPI0022B3F986|nr:hypothetical protein [Burkholderia sp. IMCC1007]